MNHVTLVCGCIVIVLHILYWFFKYEVHSFLEYLFSKQHNPGSSCDSPECTRCQKYNSLQKSAMTKFKRVSEAYSDRETLCRIKKALGKASNQPATYYRQRQQPNILYIHGISSSPWWTDHSVFETMTTYMKTKFETISKEFGHIFESMDESSWKRNTSKNGSWTVFYLYNQGQKNYNNCKQCPNTTALVENNESFMSSCVFGNACFSVLEPGAHIVTHCGPVNFRLRIHLGKF